MLTSSETYKQLANLIAECGKTLTQLTKGGSYAQEGISISDQLDELANAVRRMTRTTDAH